MATLIPPEIGVIPKAPVETTQQVSNGVISEKDQSPEVAQVQAVIAEFLEDCVRVNVGKGYTKLVDYTDFADSFSKFMNKKAPEVKKMSLLLPNNVFWLAYSPTQIEISSYYTGGVKKVNYRGNSVDRVTPNIIISHVLDSNKGKWTIETGNSFFLATDLSLSMLTKRFYKGPSIANRVYVLPFSNMYDTGAMCTGENQLPRVFENGDLRSLNSYYDMIFNSPFNSDLGVKALGYNNPYSGNPSDWFAYLAKLAKEVNPEFPYREIAGFVPIKPVQPPVANVPVESATISITVPTTTVNINTTNVGRVIPLTEAEAQALNF